MSNKQNNPMSKSNNPVSIYSMLSNDQSFPAYEKKSNGASKVSVNIANTAILIKGGANVADQYHKTIPFVETQISAEDYKKLEENPVFKRMVERGFLTTEVPTVMKKDKAAPLTEKDIKTKNAKAIVKTNEAKAD